MNSDIAKVQQLKNMIDYQKDAAVSKTVIKQKTGSVTLFSFDIGQDLSEHTAPFDALVYVFDGQAEITIAGETVTVKEGEIIVMPANKPHALKAASRFKMMLTMVRS